VIPKSPRFQSKKLRDSARNQSCVWCGNDEEGKVVLCHISHKNSGMALKCPDYMSADLCNECHDRVDGRTEESVDLSFKARLITESFYRRVQRGTYQADGEWLYVFAQALLLVGDFGNNTGIDEYRMLEVVLGESFNNGTIEVK